MAEAADLVVLAVKPNVLDEVAGDLAETGVAGHLDPRRHHARAAPGGAARHRVVRVMPNLGAQLRQARALRGLPRRRRATSCASRSTGLLALLGEVVEIDESLIDAATAMMGCTPGYLALMAEVLVEEGAKQGLTEDQSLRMVARSMAATGGLLEPSRAGGAEAGGRLARAG